MSQVKFQADADLKQAIVTRLSIQFQFPLMRQLIPLF